MTFFEELKDLLRGPLDLIPLANAAVYSLGFSIFGTPVGKCIVIGVVAFAATKLHYGRRELSRVGVLVMIASTVVWADLIPDTHELAQKVRGVVAEFQLYTKADTGADRLAYLRSHDDIM
jgi:hypothetical protein